MRILAVIAIFGLPLMALGQSAEPQETQGQTKEKQTTAPEAQKKARPEQEQTNPQVRPEKGQTTNGQGPNQDVNRNKPGAHPETRERNVNQSTTVNKEEFRSRHSEVFNLGRHPKEFFIQRFGATHVRLIGNAYFVFVDGCWVAVDVDGFTFSEQTICPGDPEFIQVD